MGTASVAAFGRKSVGWSIALSIVMIAAGIVAILSPFAAGIAINIFVGWLLVFSGAVHLIFGWHRSSTGGLFWELLVGVVYILIGAFLLAHPVRGLASLTIALAFYLLFEAIFEFAQGFTLRGRPGSGWLFFHGIITLILAVMIWRAWPSSAAWAIGLLVGIDMLFSGASRLMLSLSARRLAANLS